MKTARHHIISKVVVDVHVRHERTAQQLKNNISRFLQDEVFPELESLLDSYPTSEIVRFDRMTIEIDKADPARSRELTADIRRAVARQLEIRLAATPPADAGLPTERPEAVLSRDEARFSTLITVLETGTLPWFGLPAYWDELREPATWQSLLGDSSRLARLRQLLAGNHIAFNRFSKQLSLPQIFAFVEACDVVRISDPDRFSNYLADSPVQWSDQLLAVLLGHSVGAPTPSIAELIRFWVEAVYSLQPKTDRLREIFATQLARYFEADSWTCFFEGGDAVWVEMESGEAVREVRDEQPDAGRDPSAGRPAAARSAADRALRPQPETAGSSEKPNELLVANAGLILAIPFLRPLFRRFNLLDQTNGLLPEFREMAAQMLHFTATGVDDAPEFLMLFEKFLCGIPTAFPLSRVIRLTDPIRIECDEMLRELIRQWPALKSTSPDGLRQLFLQRSAKLMKTETGYRLIVERKAQDVLLERLPWNVAVLQMPFSKQLLFTEW